MATFDFISGEEFRLSLENDYNELRTLLGKFVRTSGQEKGKRIE